MVDHDLMKIVAESDPGGPTEEEYEAYQKLLEMGYSASFIDQQVQAHVSAAANMTNHSFSSAEELGTILRSI